MENILHAFSLNKTDPENNAYIMPCVTTHAVTSCMHCTVHACRQASHPYVNVVCQELLVDMPFTPAELYLIKLTTSHFSTLNTKIANQNVLKMVLIAMHNENKADCNENFKLCSEESIGPLYKWLTSKGLLGQRYYNYNFCSGPFWTHKIETTAKYNSISNTLHLLSTPVSIPHVGAVLAKC